MENKLPHWNRKIGTIWIDTSIVPHEFYMKKSKMWKFIGYGRKDGQYSLFPVQRRWKAHKKDVIYKKYQEVKVLFDAL
jgi:hypothetical protein